jgi:hypothetical protein
MRLHKSIVLLARNKTHTALTLLSLLSLTGTKRLRRGGRRIKESSASKILAPVPEGKGFNFYLSIDIPAGKYAAGLQDFCKQLAEVDARSVAFHLEREDFQNWLRKIVGDDELATELSGLKGTGLGLGELQSKVYDAVKLRCDELSGTLERR